MWDWICWNVQSCQTADELPRQGGFPVGGELVMGVTVW